MKKIISLFVLTFLAVGIISYYNLNHMLASFLTRDLEVPVSVEKIEISQNGIIIKNLHIKNPENSKTETALLTKTISITGISGYFSKRLLIDNITFKDSDLKMEYYNSSGEKNNWSVILSDYAEEGSIGKEKEKEYLIKTLAINKLKVSLTDYSGKTEGFPTIDHLEFHNISNETGFPFDDIEKAILHTIMQAIFAKYNIFYILKKINPLRVIPKIFSFPFKSYKKAES